jgi:hypothetical protein
MRIMMFAAASLGLAACTAPTETARQRADAHPAPSPKGILASHPPGDSSFYPLRCLTYGPETVCKRDTD